MKQFVTIVTALWLLIACNTSLAYERGVATAIAWSPDGETIAVASTTGLWLFDTDFNEIGFVPTPALDAYPPSTMDWHASGKWIALSNHNYQERYDHDRSRETGFPILVIDVAQRKVVSTVQFPRLSTEIRWHPAETLILGGEFDGRVKIVDAFSGDIQLNYRKSRASSEHVYHKLTAVCWHSESAAIAVTHNTVYVFDFVSGETLHRIEQDKGYLSFKTASCHNGGRIITDLGYSIHVDTGTVKRIFSLDSTFTFKDYWYDEWDIVDISWSPDGSRIATNGNAGLCRIGVFDGDAFTLLAELHGSHAKQYGRYHADSIAWHPEGSRFAIVGKLDIRIWDASSYRLLRVFEGFEKRNPIPHDPTPDTSDDKQIIDMETWGLHCPALPDSSEAAEIRLAALASRHPS